MGAGEERVCARVAEAHARRSRRSPPPSTTTPHAHAQEGAALLGRTANDLREVVIAGGGAGEGNPEFERVLKGALFRDFFFTVKVKMEYVKDEQRIKGTVIKLAPVHYGRECRALLSAIKLFPQHL